MKLPPGYKLEKGGMWGREQHQWSGFAPGGGLVCTEKTKGDVHRRCWAHYNAKAS